MRKILVILGALLMVHASEVQVTQAQVAQCFCVGGPVEKQFVEAASIFIGDVVEVSGPREVLTSSGVQKFYVTRFFVWDRWKGAKGFDVEILTPLLEDSCVAYPPMSIGATYLVFANPLSVKNASPKIQGIVTSCTLTSLFVGAGPEPTVRSSALATIFELDKLTNPPPQRTPAFGRKPVGKDFCLFC